MVLSPEVLLDPDTRRAMSYRWPWIWTDTLFNGTKTDSTSELLLAMLRRCYTSVCLRAM